MAVPTSGTLSQLALAQEALYATYGSGTVTGPISLYDMVNGGNTNGSGNSYPAVNQNCLPNPANRSSLELITVIAAMGGGVATYYYNSYFGNASNLVVGNQLFSNSTLTTFMPADSYSQTGTTSSKTFCDQGGVGSLVVGQNGLITSISCTPL
tara:strand:+ start:397 stop:855 length:459 start_codon:yes stop_codon:yes gene_type:complete